MKQQPFSVTNLLKIRFLATVLAFLATFPAFSEESPSGEKFNPGEMIIHHIGDAYDWHIATIGGHHYSIPLPIILYSPGKENPLDIFSSSKLASHGHGDNPEYKGYKFDHHGHIISTDGRKFYDFSITKNAASIIVGGILVVLIFLSVAAGFKKNAGKAPRGIQSFMEPIILFVRDDIAIPNIGKHRHSKYLPLLLTIFFFIWVNNLLGLIPTGANASGNIAFTMTLAVIVAIVVNVSGNKHYWGHIFWTPGVPLWLRPLMIIVEAVGIITRPFALMIRLFANITAGHIIILSLFSFIFVFESAFVGIPAGIFAVAMTFMELFVAALQAYIFTMLAALFIGTAVEDHHGDELEQEHAPH